MDLQQLGRERYPGATWQDIAVADGGDLPAVLRAQSNPPQDLRVIPFERYTSPGFFDLEIERMWKRVWQFACREEHLRDVGDYYVYDLARLSVVIVRAESGLKAYRNSCRHRGTKLKPSNSDGWSASLRCPFHAWEWSLEGELVSRPCDWEFPHLPAGDAGLREVRVDSWNGFVFINFSAEGPGLFDYLEVLPDHFARWDLTGWYVHTHVRKHLPANWKLSISRLRPRAQLSNSTFGAPCARFRTEKPSLTASSPAASATPTPRARSAWPTAQTRFPS